ncbi:MAG: response regulator [Bacteriovoracia bacterium]
MKDANSKPIICVVDDDTALNRGLCELLEENGYQTISFASATQFVNQHQENPVACELVISDINMPGLSGYDLCQTVRQSGAPEHLPIILITGNNAVEEKTKGLDFGADDFISKPFRPTELLAKIRSLLKIRSEQKNTLAHLSTVQSENQGLVHKLQAEIKRSQQVGTLMSFFSPKVAELLTSDNAHSILRRHRTEVSVLFVDLRGFTAFSEVAEPEDVLGVLEAYYKAVGTISLRHGGTLGHLAGDGIMIFLNDPETIADHQAVAVRMALEIRAALEKQREQWKKRDFDLDFGMGLADGYATIGGIGFEHFWQYSVIGTVANLSARLCHEAKGGQILVSQRFFSSLEAFFSGQAVGNLEFKGIHKPISVYNIVDELKQRKAA